MKKWNDGNTRASRSNTTLKHTTLKHTRTLEHYVRSEAWKANWWEIDRYWPIDTSTKHWPAHQTWMQSPYIPQTEPSECYCRDRLILSTCVWWVLMFFLSYMKWARYIFFWRGKLIEKESHIPIRVHVRARGRFAGSDETRHDRHGSTNNNSRSTNQCISMISSSKKYKGKDDCERNQRLIEKWLYHVRSMYLWFERNIIARGGYGKVTMVKSYASCKWYELSAQRNWVREREFFRNIRVVLLRVGDTEKWQW